MKTECFGQDKISPRSSVCHFQGSAKLNDHSEGVRGGDVKMAGVSPILVGIITALVTALLTGLIVMAMMRFACSDSNRVQSSGKREA